MTGVMNGTHILQYVPLHKGALEVASKLEEWIHGCWPKERGELKLLTEKDWFCTGRRVAIAFEPQPRLRRRWPPS
jgi:hypothetical protein